jgi:hypothetical protein
MKYVFETTIYISVLNYYAPFNKSIIVYQSKIRYHQITVPITSKFVSTNTAHGEMFSIQHYVIKLDSDVIQVGGFLRILLFPPPIVLRVGLNTNPPPYKTINIKNVVIIINYFAFSVRFILRAIQVTFKSTCINRRNDYRRQKLGQSH